MTLTVRPMTQTDVPACKDIINYTISLGGTTAHEDLFEDDDFAQNYFRDPKIVNVVLSDSRIVGFQAVFEVEPGIYSIGSFTDQQTPVRGAGRALAAQMIKDCRADGGTAILAKITSDNAGGLAFYGAVGFQDWKMIPNDHTRKDGTMVDRIVKRFVL